MMYKRLLNLSGRWFRRRLLTAALALGIAGALLPQSAQAHILNEKSQFPDIEASPARFDIVLLVGAGVLPQTPVFEPERTLTREDLAAWAALAAGLSEGGETPDPDALAAAALEAGLVESLEGNATLAEVNQAIFGGGLEVDEPQRTPTREEAAAFIAAHLSDPVEDGTLLAKLGLDEGPTGKVEAVDVQEEQKDGRTTGTYFFTIGDDRLPVDGHARVANGPTDLLQWEGLTVGRSFVRAEGGDKVLTFLQAGVPEEEAGEAAEHEPAEEEQNDQTAEESAEPEEPSASPAGGPPYLLYGIGAAAVLLALALFGRRRTTP